MRRRQSECCRRAAVEGRLRLWDQIVCISFFKEVEQACNTKGKHTIGPENAAKCAAVPSQLAPAASKLPNGHRCPGASSPPSASDAAPAALNVSDPDAPADDESVCRRTARA